MSCSTCRGWHSFSQATLKWPEHPKIWSKTPFLWHNFGHTLSKWPQATLNFKIWGAMILRSQILVFLTYGGWVAVNWGKNTISNQCWKKGYFKNLDFILLQGNKKKIKSISNTKVRLTTHGIILYYYCVMLWCYHEQNCYLGGKIVQEGKFLPRYRVSHNRCLSAKILKVDISH